MLVRRNRSLTYAVLLMVAVPASAATTDELIRTIKAVGKEGAGHPAAIKAVKELSSGDSQTLLPLLKTMDDASPLAVNWLRGAFEAIAARELKSTGKLPAAELEAFLHRRVYRHHRVMRMVHKGQRMIRMMFEEFSQHPGQMPERYAKMAAEGHPERTACDYLAGMTDRFAQDEFMRLFHPYTPV